MNNKQQQTSLCHPKIDNSEKRVKILLKFIREEVNESNCKLINTKKSNSFSKLRLYIKQNQQKIDILFNALNQSIEKAIEQRSLSFLMNYKKIIQSFNFTQMIDIQRLTQLDSKINNYIFENEEDPFQFYNTKVYQIIINNKFLFRNRKLLTMKENKKVSIIITNQQGDALSNSNIKINKDTVNKQQFIDYQIKTDQDKQLCQERMNKEDCQKDNSGSSSTENNHLNGNQSGKCQNNLKEQDFCNLNSKLERNNQNHLISLAQGENQQSKVNGSNEVDIIQQQNRGLYKEIENIDKNIKGMEEQKTNEDIKLEELFNFIFPTLNDTFHQLTELENIIFLMSMTVNRHYHKRLKCTVYGSYMMGFQLSKSSDIDVSLELENYPQIANDQNSKIEFLTKLEENLKQSDQLEVNSFFNAPVPGFQVRKQSIFNKEYKVKIDFTVGNQVGIAKTSLLKIYSSLSIKIQQLVCLFKYFIQVKNIDKFTLSSIAQTNMVVFFLLKKNYVPNVQKYFNQQEQMNYFNHQYINEMDIKKVIEENNLLQKLNSTPLFTLFTELITYYHDIVSQKSKQTLVISLLEPPAQIDENSAQYKNFPFIIKEYYDQNYSIQPNIQFNFINFQTILNQTHQFIQNYDYSSQLGQFINQIFSYSTQNNINQKNKQELIDEFNLEISSNDFDEDDSDVDDYYFQK
ncbi:hypothetical protein TTHERM_00581790 (macronuclear) [Tetrahymena thermophila SB210]|uniref:Poly(A) RNA polymerase mitochondrial-like central palm domain-containing protein n=1 Tax=Tetrahymena thermophila (strain SB210) TaxID=312017 RepID=Q23QA9_TETTS|nr:hypothetical protein TTHERM_00581790 [Tetrahymena thermophila SB210]EAR98675.2 hypothetical protein TTHERM_00581790 [Tetrahymena thermophila SB210]|eukprot:XP_001018920.2 hypothetical protein TTHERM_00581790 [Tetrahymena thermophila SB210]